MAGNSIFIFVTFPTNPSAGARPSPGLLKLQYACKQLGELVKMQI